MTSISVLLIVLCVATGHILASWMTATSANFQPTRITRSTASVAIVLALIFGAAALTSGSGLLNRFDAIPPNLMRYMLPHLVLAVAIGAFSVYGRRLALGLPLAALIGIQVFRLPLELVLDQLYREGVAPIQVTFHGSNLDILLGLSALPMAWLAARGRATRSMLVIWNVIGIALLANIVVVALLSLPGPLRRYPADPSTAFIATFPYILIPTMLVTTALFGHVLLARRIYLESRGIKANQRKTEHKAMD